MTARRILDRPEEDLAQNNVCLFVSLFNASVSFFFSFVLINFAQDIFIQCNWSEEADGFDTCTFSVFFFFFSVFWVYTYLS